MPLSAETVAFHQLLKKERLTQSTIATSENEGYINFEYPDNLDLVTFTGLFNADRSSGNFEGFKESLGLLHDYLETFVKKTGHLPHPLNMRGLAIDIQHKSVEIIPPYSVKKIDETYNSTIIPELVMSAIDELIKSTTDAKERKVLEVVKKLRINLGRRATGFEGIS